MIVWREAQRDIKFVDKNLKKVYYGRIPIQTIQVMSPIQKLWKHLLLMAAIVIP